MTLILLFTILFIPHAFVVVRDINLVTAYEVDPGSIIDSILKLYPNHYNMEMAYHSRFYGWTYFALNFLLLMPVYLLRALKILGDDYYVFVMIRLIFFTIGLASTLAFFEVAKRTLKHDFLSLLAAILYIACPAVFMYFYFLHPETTGLLFLFLGILCFLRFDEEKADDRRWYTVGLISLVLSGLSKQIFVLTALPVLFLYVHSHCRHHETAVLGSLVSRGFMKVLSLSIVLSILIFFAIDPFAFFHWQLFIKDQLTVSKSGFDPSVSIQQAIWAWIGIIKALPILLVSLASFPVALLGAAILLRSQTTGRMLYVVNAISAFLIMAVVMATPHMIRPEYLAPIYPFFVLNVLSIPIYIVRRWNAQVVKLPIWLSLTYFLFLVLLHDSSISIPMGYARLNYQNSLIYEVYNYVEDNIPTGSRIAHDRFVAIPSDKGITGCHFWQGCGTDYIEEFRPDYVMFVENWTFNGSVLPETARLEEYVNDHRFELEDTIQGNSTDIGGGNYSVSIWKKPGH